MGLISQTIKNLKGGISQQPDILRYPDQGAEQVNAYSSETTGLTKRPPTIVIKRLGNSGHFGNRPLTHFINRDATERYVVNFKEGTGDIFITDIFTGQPKPVTFEGKAKGYVTTSNPREDLRMVTVADYTFIINRNVTIKNSIEKVTPPYVLDKHALIICSGGQYGRTYRVKINGHLAASYKTPYGNNTEDSTYVDIQYILQVLANGINNTKGTTGYLCTVHDGYLFLKPHSNQSSKLTSLIVEDGYNGMLLSSIIHTTMRTTDLPLSAPPNYTVEITGEAGAGTDNFWVMYDATKKVWQECPAPNTLTSLDGATMPHVLIRQSDGTFICKAADWGKRAAGDEDTNPWPSFLDSTITDIFFFRNRLGLISGENVILSASAKYFDFFQPSVAVMSDTDPIDVAVSTNKISLLKYAVPFAEDLLLWSDHNQFVLGADGVLSPTSVRLDLTTEFEVDGNARPYGIGKGVYFVSPRATYSSIRRFYAVQEVSQVKNAEDISAHTPAYIPNGVFSLSGSSTENYLTVLTEGATNKLFLYKFLYVRDELLQQSWSHWEFGTRTRIVSCNSVGSLMYLILDTPQGTFLEKVNFTDNVPDFNSEIYRLHTDHKVQYTIPTGSYNLDTNLTTFTLSNIYGATPVEGDYLVMQADGDTRRFPMPTGGWGGSGTLTIDGDWSGKVVTVGKQYVMRYKFSKFLIKKTDPQGGSSTEDVGRLQLRRAWVNYEQSGSFNIEVNTGVNTFSYVMSGMQLGDSSWVLSEPAFGTGQFRFPASGNANNVEVTLTSNAPTPVAIIGAGWEGNYMRRSSGV